MKHVSCLAQGLHIVPPGLLQVLLLRLLYYFNPPRSPQLRSSGLSNVLHDTLGGVEVCPSPIVIDWSPNLRPITLARWLSTVFEMTKLCEREYSVLVMSIIKDSCFQLANPSEGSSFPADSLCFVLPLLIYFPDGQQKSSRMECQCTGSRMGI